MAGEDEEDTARVEATAPLAADECDDDDVEEVVAAATAVQQQTRKVTIMNGNAGGGGAKAAGSDAEFSGLEQVPKCRLTNMTEVMTKSIENAFYR